MRFLVTVECISDPDEGDESMSHIADTSTLRMEVDADSNFGALIAAPQTGEVK